MQEGDCMREQNIPDHPKSVNITVVNEIGGNEYERRQYQYRVDETTRRGPSLVKARR